MASQVSAHAAVRIDLPHITSTDGGSANAGGQPITDGQGREYSPRIDTATGHLLLEHHSSAASQDGGRVDLAITIDIAPDQSFVRTVDQQLHAANGDTRSEQTIASYTADGTQISESTTGQSRSASQSSNEQTRTEFSNGEPTARITDLSTSQHAMQPTGDRVDAEVSVHAEWRDGGRPITQSTVPVIDRRERVTYTTPDGGINKGTDRTVTTELHAVGPINALTYPKPMKVVVHFAGRSNQYIERELSVPVDQTGAPNYDRATTVRNEDHQHLLTKAATQARIWGGFAGSWMGVLGVRLLPAMRGAGSVLMYAGVGASVAGVAGEAHAIATRRNDASVGRLAMELYDTTWLGLLVASRRGAASRSMPATGAQAALALGGAVQGIRLINDLTGSGPLRRASSQLDLAHLEPSLGYHTSTGAQPDWRLEPRFDPSSVVRANL